MKTKMYGLEKYVKKQPIGRLMEPTRTLKKRIQLINPSLYTSDSNDLMKFSTAGVLKHGLPCICTTLSVGICCKA